MPENQGKRSVTFQIVETPAANNKKKECQKAQKNDNLEKNFTNQQQHQRFLIYMGLILHHQLNKQAETKGSSLQ